MGTANETAFASSQLGQLNNIVGAKESMSVTFTFTSSGSGTAFANLGGGVLSGDVLGSGVTVPIAYDFTLAKTGGVVVTLWAFSPGFDPNPTSPSSVTGSGVGNFSGTTNFVTGASTTSYLPFLQINFSSANNGNTITLTMNPATQGIAINATAIPEPSTYAGLLGLAAGVLALLRRRRRFVAIG